LSIFIIESKDKDIPLLMDFLKSYNEYDDHLFNTTLVKASLEDLIKHPTLGRIWLIYIQNEAFPNGRNIGYIILTFGYSLEFYGRDGFIEEFFIVEEMRGKGIGNKVVEIVFAKANDLGIKAIHLEVVAKNFALGLILYYQTTNLIEQLAK
jgi:diamine N-acetyltransferase